MNTRNWLDLSRKLVDRFDMNYSFSAIQEALGEYALAWFGEGVVNTSQYPNPFPITMSGSVLGGAVGFGIGFDLNGQLTNVTAETLSSPDFTLQPIGSLPRYDLLCIKYLSEGDTPVPKPSDPLTTIFLNLHDDFQLVVVEGTPSGTPAYPAKGNPLYIVLAGIQIPANATLGTQCTIDYSQREQANANTSNYPVFAQEVPSGVIDGVNTTFTLSQSPINNSSLIVSQDGLTLVQGVDYTIIGQSITMAVAPALGQSIDAYYIVNSVNSQNPLTGAQEVPSGTPNGSTSTFALVGKPANQASTIVYVDGMEVPLVGWNLIQGVSNGSIHFNSGYIPATGQDVYVFYLVNPFVFGSQPPSPNLTNAINLGAGYQVLAGVVSGVAQFKTLVQGANITLSEDANTVTIAASGGGGGSGGLTVYGDPTPLTITAGGGVTSTTDQRAIQYLKTSGGPVVVTANPQISAGTLDGQELYLAGTSATNYPILANGNGLSLNGPIDLTDNSGIILIWKSSTSLWIEMSRR